MGSNSSRPSHRHPTRVRHPVVHDGGSMSRKPHRRSSGPERRQQPKVIPRAGSDVYCNICCNSGGDVVIPVAKVTSQCLRNRTICEECLQRHIHEAVLKQGYHQIRCICTSSKCPAKLDFAQIQEYARPDTFRLYDEGLIRQTLEKNAEFCWCSRAGCGSGQLHSSRHKYPIMTCCECHAKTCFSHRCEWHEGRTCEQYDVDGKSSEEVGLLQLLQSSKYRRCPSCNHGVEKKSGCDHMTCRCKHEFCWRCLAPYKGDDGIWKIGNSAHKKSCIHYRRA